MATIQVTRQFSNLGDGQEKAAMIAYHYPKFGIDFSFKMIIVHFLMVSPRESERERARESKREQERA